MRQNHRRKRFALLIVSLTLSAAAFSYAMIFELRPGNETSEAGSPTRNAGNIDRQLETSWHNSVEASADFETFEATAYCDNGITFSGIRVRRGIVAADPEILPIGSVIEIQAGDYTGVYTVMDTGGRVKGEIIDIFMPDYEEAVQFGRQNVKLRVLRYGWQPVQPRSYNASLAG